MSNLTDFYIKILVIPMRVACFRKKIWELSVNMNWTYIPLILFKKTAGT